MTDKHSAGEQAAEKLVTHLGKIGAQWDLDDFDERNGLILEIANGLTAAIAEAKLAGELAGREAAACMFHPHRELDCKLEGCDYSLPERQRADAIRNLPLTPDSAGVLERIKRAERARGAEEAYRRCAEQMYLLSKVGGMTEQQVTLCVDSLGLMIKWAAEQAAIADGKGDEDATDKVG